MGFSDLLDNMFYWTCDLCGNEVVILNRKQDKDESCLCMKCILIELKMESKLIKNESK
jgi:hypothetical protein